MLEHRQAFPTPRGGGKSDPEGGLPRLPDVVARRLWWDGTLLVHVGVGPDPHINDLFSVV